MLARAVLARSRTAVAALFCVAAFVTLPTAVASAAWHQPGSALNADPNKAADYPRVADVGGVPYVAWQESNGTNYQVRVASLNGGAWKLVGGVLNVDPNEQAGSSSIADVGGVPFVAWSEKSSGGNYRVHVASLSGGHWRLVGGMLNVDANNDANDPRIADVGGVPYVAWAENTTSGYQVHVASFNGTSWQPVGAALYANPGEADFGPSIADVAGLPYVAWTESDGTNYRVYAASLNGGNWHLVGGALNADPNYRAGSPSTASVGGVPYVAWTENDGVKDWIRVAYFNGASWRLVGHVLNADPTQNGDSPSLASIGGVPYVVWQESKGTIDQVRVAHFNGTGWRLVAGVLNADASKDARNSSIATVGGVPYVAWSENDGTVEQVRVGRLEPDFLSETATPAATGARLSAQVNDYGVPLTVGFEYGTGPAFGTQTPLRSTAGTGVTTISRQVEGLAPNRRYFYRAFGSDTVRETSIGPTLSFTTLAVGSTGSGGTRPGGRRSGGSSLTDQISHLKITPSSFVAAAAGPSATIARAPKTGAIVSYTGTQQATTTFTVQRATTGRVHGGSCLNPTRKNRAHRRCSRFLNIGSFTHRDLAGANRLHFTGRIHGRMLTPDSYRLQAIPRNSAGPGRAVYTIFRVKS